MRHCIEQRSNAMWNAVRQSYNLMQASEPRATNLKTILTSIIIIIFGLHHLQWVLQIQCKLHRGSLQHERCFGLDNFLLERDQPQNHHSHENCHHLHPFHPHLMLNLTCINVMDSFWILERANRICWELCYLQMVEAQTNSLTQSDHSWPLLASFVPP